MDGAQGSQIEQPEIDALKANLAILKKENAYLNKKIDSRDGEIQGLTSALEMALDKLS